MKNILLVGLGAIGSIYASKIYDNGLNIKVLVDAGRYERYRSEKTTINNVEYDFDYILPDSNFKADLILIATKSIGFGFALENIGGFIGENTVIVSLLNGIESEERLRKQYPDSKVVPAFYIGAASVRKGRNIEYKGESNIIFGYDCEKVKPAALKLKEFFDEQNIQYKFSDDIKQDMWVKFMLNVALNEVTAAYDLDYGKLKNSKEALELCENLMREVQMVAKAEGIIIPDEKKQAGIDIVLKQDDCAQTSMLQDMRQKRKTEVDIFALTVINKGKLYGIKTPYCDEIYKIIKEKEANF